MSFFKAVLWSLHWTIGFSYKTFKCYKKLCICMYLIPVHQRSVSFLTKIKALFWLILNFKPPQEVTELLCSFKNCIALRFCYNLDPNWCHIFVLLIGQGHICIKTFLTYCGIFRFCDGSIFVEHVGTSYPRINMLHELINKDHKVTFPFADLRKYMKLRPHKYV